MPFANFISVTVTFPHLQIGKKSWLERNRTWWWQFKKTQFHFYLKNFKQKLNQITKKKTHTHRIFSTSFLSQTTNLMHSSNFRLIIQHFLNTTSVPHHILSSTTSQTLLIFFSFFLALFEPGMPSTFESVITTWLKSMVVPEHRPWEWPQPTSIIITIRKHWTMTSPF